MGEFWKVALSVAGLGAVACFLFWSLYKRWLNMPIFQVLTKKQQFILFVLFFSLTFVFAVLALGSYVYISSFDVNKQHREVLINEREQNKGEHYKIDDLKASVRFQYFSLGGHSINYLVNKKISSAWEPSLSGSPFIVKNSVFSKIEYFINNFSYQPNPSTIQIKHLDGFGYPKERYYEDDNLIHWARTNKVMAGTVDSDYFYENNLTFVLDEKAAKNAISDIIKSPNYWSFVPALDSTKLNHKPSGDVLSDAIQYSRFWKFANFNDVMTLSSLKAFDSYSEKTIRLYSYIANQYLPEDFLIAFLTQGFGCGDSGSLEFRIIPRPLSIDILLVENTSSESIRIDGFMGRENDSHMLRTIEEDNEVLKVADQTFLNYYPLIVLKPDERIIIPLRIKFGQLYEPMREALLSDRKLLKDYLYRQLMAFNKIGGMIDIPYFTNDGKVGGQFHPKTLIALIENADIDNESIVSEYVYDCSVFIDKISINGSWMNVREYDSKYLVIQNGYQRGSCPYIYTYHKEKKKWVLKDHVLINRDESGKEGEDEMIMSPMDNRIMIKEEDDEVSYINHVYLKIINDNGSIKKIYPKDRRINQDDNEYLVLRQGEAHELSFNENRLLKSDNIRLVIKGYYVPNAPNARQIKSENNNR